jgi:AraC-type DNA-binding domain-containing proteins
MHALLRQVMDEKKLYTNPELTLAELAQALEVHPNNLSQVINTYEAKNFYDYINLKRIEEFKRIVALPENQRFTLLAIAHDCGFNSKTSFNRNFKNATGLSPREYLNQAHIELVS